ncbi:uncharacterized protein BDV17DRAFT_34812 [Aspergillus undulatus]|uniref:uncharacterized protein n=1 Tax=Aspergillus undulatus TaxID=1810928 RepID=UPI003CCDDA75
MDKTSRVPFRSVPFRAVQSSIYVAFLASNCLSPAISADNSRRSGVLSLQGLVLLCFALLCSAPFCPVCSIIAQPVEPRPSSFLSWFPVLVLVLAPSVVLSCLACIIVH